MLTYRNPNKCIYSSCNIRCKKLFCKKHIKAEIDYIPYYKQVDPFVLELKIINFQTLFKNRLNIRKNRFIISNITKIVNNKDPISREIILNNKHLQMDINLIYPISYNNFIYIYKLESLMQIINSECNEVISNTPISKKDINSIKKLFQQFNLKIEEEQFSEEELFHFKKTKTFQKLDILGTYFPINMYDKLTKNQKEKIYQELRLMWTTFCIDNGLNEQSLFNKKIQWLYQDNIDSMLIEKINLLLKDDFDSNLKKMISYLIIGAFVYVIPNFRKIYNNFDFI